MPGELSSHMKHSVNHQILNKLNSLQGNGSITLDNQIHGFPSLKKTSRLYKTYDDITKLSGWGYNPKTGLSTSTPDVIETYVAAHPLASKFAEKKMEGYEVVHSFWQDTHATGGFASGSQTSDKKHNVKDKRKNSEIYSDDSQNEKKSFRFEDNKSRQQKYYAEDNTALKSSKEYHRDQDNFKNAHKIANKSGFNKNSANNRRPPRSNQNNIEIKDISTSSYARLNIQDEDQEGDDDDSDDDEEEEDEEEEEEDREEEEDIEEMERKRRKIKRRKRKMRRIKRRKRKGGCSSSSSSSSSKCTKNYQGCPLSQGYDFNGWCRR